MSVSSELEADVRLVAEFDRKLQIIRDRVNSVVHCYHTACYVVGRPGTSKTFTIKQALEDLEVPWQYRNARMTPMGMFNFIAEYPEHILVLDDIGTLFKNDQALQILLAALDGDPGKSRLVTYKSKDENLKVWFSGGMIVISNTALRHDPLARALGSRVTILEHEPNDDEIAAFMRHLALKGYKDLSVEECSQVADFVIAETRGSSQRLDLRHLTKAWEDYRQCRDGKAETPWQVLVQTSLQKLLTETILPLSKHDEIEHQRQMVKELSHKYPGDTRRQLAESGLGKSTFYSRRKELMAC
jgi:hypothetical protein